MLSCICKYVTVESNTKNVLNDRYSSVTFKHSERKMVPKVLEHFITIFPQKLPPGLLLPGNFPSRKIYDEDKNNNARCREIVSFVNPFAGNSGKLCFNSSRPIKKLLIYEIMTRVLKDFLLNKDSFY